MARRLDFQRDKQNQRAKRTIHEAIEDGAVYEIKAEFGSETSEDSEQSDSYQRNAVKIQTSLKVKTIDLNCKAIASRLKALEISRWPDVRRKTKTVASCAGCQIALKLHSKQHFILELENVWLCNPCTLATRSHMLE